MEVDTDAMQIEQPPHLEVQEEKPVTKKIVLADDENDFDSMNIRPESLFLRGVDDLSPRNIKLYVDHYIKPDYSFSNKDKYESLRYKIEWINDSSLNIVFNDSESAMTALLSLSNTPIDQLLNTEERPAKEYINEEGESKVAELYIRQSFSYDKKIKNAKEYSRYYLLHGEPDKNDRPKRDYYKNFKKDKYRERDYSYRDEEPDLITGEIVKRKEDEEDLIPNHRSLQDRIGVPQKSRRRRDRRRPEDEEDLFPDFQSRKRYRSRSPTRADDMDVDENKSLNDRIQSKGRSMEDLLGL